MSADKEFLNRLNHLDKKRKADGNRITIISKKMRETEHLSFFETSIETNFEDGNEAFKHMVQFFFSWLKGRQEIPYEAVTTLLDEVYFGSAELKLGDAVEMQNEQ